MGHAYLNKCLDGFLDCPIRHVHIHDNDGKDDAHLPVGDGSIDFGKVMNAVMQNGAVPIIEVSSFTGVQDSIARLEQIAGRMRLSGVFGEKGYRYAGDALSHVKRVSMQEITSKSEFGEFSAIF